MALQQQQPRQENASSPSLNIEIGKNVMRILGQPRDFCTVQVRPLWDDRYRVNVLTGTDMVSAKVAHSFFLLVDREGNVVNSTPKITKHY